MRIKTLSLLIGAISSMVVLQGCAHDPHNDSYAFSYNYNTGGYHNGYHHRPHYSPPRYVIAPPIHVGDHRNTMGWDNHGFDHSNRHDGRGIHPDGFDHNGRSDTGRSDHGRSDTGRTDSGRDGRSSRH